MPRLRLKKRTAILLTLLMMILVITVPTVIAAPSAPVVVSGEVTNKGDYSLTFNQAIANPTGTQGQFSLTVQGKAVIVTAVETTNTVGKIKLVLATKASAGQDVAVEYVKSDNPALQIKSADGIAAESFTYGKAEQPDNPQPPVSPSGKTVIMIFNLGQNTYTINGQNTTMDVSPVVVENRTLLPIRFAADPLGAVTEWNGNENKVTVTLGTTKIELWIGSNTALINGVSTMIDPNNPDVKPLIINNRTMLPMRFVTEKLGCDVEWIPPSQINVNYPKAN